VSNYESLSYAARVKQAMDEAPLTVPSQLSSGFNPGLADKPLDFPVEVNVGYERVAGSALIANVKEFHGLLAALNEVAGYELYDRTYPSLSVAEIVRHERQHEYVGGRQKAKSVFGLQLVKYPSDDMPDGELALRSCFYVPTELYTTKLGYAAICAYPGEGTSADEIAVQGMGFASIEDVAWNILDYNQRLPTGALWLPIPLQSPHVSEIQFPHSARFY
jgi:hypothetical protein